MLDLFSWIGYSLTNSFSPGSWGHREGIFLSLKRSIVLECTARQKDLWRDRYR